ncbi:hypothetical protein BH09VER1_BH09VER1_22940 [soil metagenome]
MPTFHSLASLFSLLGSSIPFRRWSVLSALVLVGAIGSVHAAAYTYVLASGTSNWSLTSSWSPTGTPNAIGDVVQKSLSTTTGVFQDVAAGVTVGGISTTNGTFTIQTDNTITFNNGGTGATLGNFASTGSTALVTLGIGSGTPAAGVTLADNLSITNTFAGSTNGSGVIKINAVIGGTGNVTISNVLNTVTTGQIRMESSNTFTGTVTVAKGGVTFTKNTSFGNAANTIILGSAGQGSTTVVSSAALGGSFTLSGAVGSNILVSAGTGGTTVLGTISTAASSFTNFAGTVTLNGDLTTTSDQTVTGVGLFFSNVISGTGRLTVQGTGITSLTGANTYTGDTRISTGSLALGAGIPASGSNTTLALQNSTLDLNGSDAGALVFGTSVSSSIANATFGGLKGSRNLALVNSNTTTPGAVTLSIGNNNANTTYSGTMSGAGGIQKVGSGALTLSGSNTYGGSTVVTAGTLLVNGAVINGAVSVNSGGTLGGTGLIASTGANGLSVASGGGIAPGDGGIGTLEVNLGGTTGTAGFLSGSAFTFDLNAPGSSDVLSFTGITASSSDVAFNSNIVNFNNLGGLAAGTYTLFTFDAANGYTGTLNVGTGLGALSGSFVYNTNSIQLTVVPEPGTFALVAFGGVALLALRRRSVR